MKVHGITLGACLLFGAAVAVQGVMNGERHPAAAARKDANWRLQRSGPPPNRPHGGPGVGIGGPGVGIGGPGVGIGGPGVGIGGPQLKRVYHVPPKYGHPGHNPHRRQHPQQKVRFGPPGAPNGVRGPPPPPGWKTKRINTPPINYGMPPRKVRNPKPHKPIKYQKPKMPYSKRSQLAASPVKADSFSNTVGTEFGEQVVTDTYGAPKTVYKVHKVPQTTYGIPHPTQGSPEPPKTAEDGKSDLTSSHKVSAGSATSFVHVYQGDANSGGITGQDAELETKSSYSFGHSAAGFDKHKGKVYDDVQTGGYEPKEPKAKKGFTPPKQTFGFQPYDDKDHFSLTPSHSFFSVSSQQSVGSSGPDSLSHNYYDQKS